MPTRITRYDSTQKELWDSFISNAKNSTFLFMRDYMDYHSDRFTDCSLLFWNKEKLTAVLPANINNEALVSHSGLTYGGIIISTETRAADMIEMFTALHSYIKECLGVTKFIYKPLPYIYCSIPSEEPLYALFRAGAQITARAISTTIDNNCPIGFSTLRKRGIKKANSHGVICAQSDDFCSFWKILENVLESRHNCSPVHSIEEIELLHKRFPENIRLFTATIEDSIEAGIVVYETSQVAHFQYIAASSVGKSTGALDALVAHLTEKVYKEKRYIDFGISTEDGGTFLNEGLIAQKEGFGGRAIVYDTYEITY